MNNSIGITVAAAALLVTAVSGCVTESEDSLDDTASELSAWNWSPEFTVANSSLHPVQVATLGSTTYMVATEWDSTQLLWRKRHDDGTWSANMRIPNQLTKDRVSLAAFNGYLYMAHVGKTDGSRVWFSRFDPATETWTRNILLPYTTDQGPPALQAFDNKLFLVGIDSADDGTYPMWAATMTANEVFSEAVTIPRQWSASRPSLAVFANKLYMAHRHGATGEIVYSTHSPGTAASSWTSPSFIRVGPGGAAIRGNDVSIAAVNGYLHLVHRRFDSDLTYWTYFDRCTWASEIAIDNWETDHPVSLTASREGLVLARSEHWSANLGWDESYTAYTKTYTAPPAPERLPQCLGAI